MKNFKKVLILLVVLFIFNNVYAACNNDELNEWATKAEVKFTEITEGGLNSSEYAYVLSVTPPRDDIRIKVTDVNGDSAEGKKLQISATEEVLGVGCYTNLEEETYKIEIYGANGGACSKELLKTINYTVPRYNRFIKDSRCENSDSEYCKTFTNSTKDMTQDEFEKIVKEEESNNITTGFLNKIKSAIVNYGLYILIPLVIVSIFYFVKIRKVKKEERDR